MLRSLLRRGEVPLREVTPFARVLSEESVLKRWQTSSAASTSRPTAGPSSSEQSTVRAKEAAKFRELAAAWWDPVGPFRPLHQMNPTRAQFMTEVICDRYGLDASLPAPLEGLDVLDVGCGGGILAESLAKRGASVLGIDVNEEGLAIARAHAAPNPRISQLCTYEAITAENLAARGAKFDVVIASEVIEHVKSLPIFVQSLESCARPKAPVLITTVNRTPSSYAAAIVAAEYILQWVPKGTHEWRKFLTPAELAQLFNANTDLRLWQLAGMEYSPASGHWALGTDVSINYAAAFVHPQPGAQTTPGDS